MYTLWEIDTRGRDDKYLTTNEVDKLIYIYSSWMTSTLTNIHSFRLFVPSFILLI